MEVAIVYDNNRVEEGLKPAWGFSYFVKADEKRILVDTGVDYLILQENMKKMNIEPTKIDSIILSHTHSDHTGGLFWLIDVNHKVTVYLSHTFPHEFKERVRGMGVRIVEVEAHKKLSEKICIVEDASTQSLILRTERGLVMFASRVPEKVIDMINKAKDGDGIYLLIAGFCFFTSNFREVADSFRDAGVKRIAPCHCCGNPCKNAFKDAYGEYYIPVGVGSRIMI